MQFSDFQTIVRNNIDDVTADVSDSIDLAIKFVSNFFSLRKIDDNATIADGDLSIAKPDRCKKVLRLKIGTEYIDPADIEKLQAIEDNNEQKWYTEDDVQGGTEEVIHLTKAISASQAGKAVDIWYLAGFEPFDGDTSMDTDLPENLHPLVSTFATYFHFGIIVSNVKNNKGSYPNMTIWDVVHIWETWRVHAFDLLDNMKQQHY